ncbi:hypothetical protein ILUMI_02297 [Ignelater luminosus]|uniref:Uncharacterized protein n=1 Tax=Ignelater luminosus TaxID=2038154 RepID=A0A8K0DDP9_IGNLU|nr:hypothetical protein ILUMI_02297 [Ignelater luminosus]
MFAFVFIVCALVQLSNQEAVEELINNYLKLIAPIKSDCLKESGADEDTIVEALKMGDHPTDHNSKCFYKCFFRKYNLINDSDEIQEEIIKKYIGVPDKNDVDEIHKKCASLRGSDACDTSDKICKCVLQESIIVLTK